MRLERSEFNKKMEALESELQRAVEAGNAPLAKKETKQKETILPKPTLFKARVCFDYVTTAANQISLTEGEIINVVKVWEEKKKLSFFV